MTDRRPLHYWDSPVFISYLTGQNAERVEVARRLLNHARDGRFDLITSAFTLAEVRLYRADAAVPNDPSREDEISQLFSSPLIEFVPVTDFIGRAAWEIGRQHNRLSPADCVHIATAQEVGATELVTWDGSGVDGRRNPEKMLFYDGMLGVPPLAIVEPADYWPELFSLDDPGQKMPLVLPPPTEPQPPA